MTNKPDVKPGDWISFGSGHRPKNAVVCTVYKDNALGDIEVVYLDNRDRAINEDMIWKEGKWEFAIEGPCGGYADRNARLRSYVSQLRGGRY